MILLLQIFKKSEIWVRNFIMISNAEEISSYMINLAMLWSRRNQTWLRSKGRIPIFDWSVWVHHRKELHQNEEIGSGSHLLLGSLRNRKSFISLFSFNDSPFEEHGLTQDKKSFTEVMKSMLYFLKYWVYYYFFRKSLSWRRNWDSKSTSTLYRSFKE